MWEKSECYTRITREMVAFAKSDKMMKVSGKVDKPNTDNGFFDMLFFIGNKTSSE